MVVTVPPVIAAPWNQTAYSGRFGAMIAKTWPGPNPLAVNPPANRCTDVEQVAVGHGSTGCPLDERDLVGVLRGVREHEGRQRNLGDGRIRERALVDHRVVLLEWKYWPVLLPSRQLRDDSNDENRAFGFSTVSPTAPGGLFRAPFLRRARPDMSNT